MNLVAEKNKNKAEDNSLDTAMVVIQQQHFSGQGSTSRSSGRYNLPQSDPIIPSDCIPHLDVVSDKPRKKIWEGKRCQSGRTPNTQV